MVLKPATSRVASLLQKLRVAAVGDLVTLCANEMPVPPLEALRLSLTDRRLLMAAVYFSEERHFGRRDGSERSCASRPITDQQLARSTPTTSRKTKLSYYGKNRATITVRISENNYLALSDLVTFTFDFSAPSRSSQNTGTHVVVNDLCWLSSRNITNLHCSLINYKNSTSWDKIHIRMCFFALEYIGDFCAPECLAKLSDYVIKELPAGG